MGVDWEMSRIGRPEEDLAICSSPLAEGKDDLVEILMETYVSSLASFGVPVNRQTITVASRRAGLAAKLKTSRWIVMQYLKMYREEAYDEWRRWARAELRMSLRWVADEMGIRQILT